MKQKIYEALKQAYSSLGLGEEILRAHAEGLASLNYVTDENLSSVIGGQKTFLEGLQRQNDKRVNDALSKLRAEHSSADEKSKAGFEAEIEKLKKQLEEKGGKGDQMPDWYKSEKEAQNKLFTELSEKLKGYEALKSDYETMKSESEKQRVETAKAERANSITAKAKELGIPEWRIKEGFSIADTATDDDINSYLSGVASNIKTNTLPPKGFATHLSDDKPTKEEMDGILDAMGV